MKPEGEAENAEEAEPGLSHPPGDGSGSVSGQESSAPEIERSSPQPVAGKKVSATSLARRVSGPRTPQGKKRSKRNALKHGIFAEGVLLGGESRDAFLALRNGLKEYFRPEGTAENLFVDKLAVDFWRLRRQVVAEKAEIENAINFPDQAESRNKRQIVCITV